MKKYILFLALGFLVQIGFAQKDPNSFVNRQYAEQAHAIFGKLERDRIPYGLLDDYAFPFTDLKAYNGTLTDSTKIDVNVYGEIYKTLHAARMTPQTGNDFMDFEELATKWATYRMNNNTDENDVTLILSGLYYKYASIDSNSIINGKLNVENNELHDVYVNGVWQNPYKVHETVAIAPPVSVINSLNFSVLLPSELFLSNAKHNKIVNISADFDNNNGYQPIAFNQKINVHYQNAGTYNWKFKLEKQNGGFLFIQIPIIIKNPIFSFPTNGKNNVLISHTNHNAILRIDYAPSSNNKIKRPLIVVEGFDAESVLYPEKIGGSTTLVNFLNSTQNYQNSQLYNLLNGNNQQYDIVYVDWKNGVGDIRENAETLIKVIEWVNNEKQTNGSTAKNVVLGQSMGGLVATYALSKMEKTPGKNHDTSLFIAHDSPFQGANIPVSTQFLFRHLSDVYFSNPLAVAAGEMILPFIQNLSSLMGSNFLSQYVSPSTILGIQDTPAALQMTKYHITPNNQVTDIHFSTWRNQFESMGYPQQTRNVAISNGNMCAEPQEVNAGEQMFLISETLSTKNGLKEFLYHLGASLWGITSGNYQLGIVAALPGKAKIDYVVDLRAIPEQSQNNRLVYRGKIRYHVKLFDLGFWTPTISTDVVPLREKSAPTFTYPLETFSGGVNSLKSVVDGVNFINFPDYYFKKPRYGFIPVASALDIRRSNGNLTVNDFKTPYYHPVLSDANLSTPFDNFVTEKTVENNANFGHISFSLKNSNWLATELLANANSTNNFPENCSFLCEANEIFGNNRVCSFINYTYSIPTPPADATIHWTVDGMEIVSGQGTPQVVINTLNISGTKKIKVTITSQECGVVTLQKNVRIGVPTMFGDIEGNNTITVYNNININTPLTYTAPSAIGATYYEWILPGNFEIVQSFGSHSTTPQNWQLLASTQNSNQIQVKSPHQGQGQIKVRACNDCGCTAYTSLNVNHVYKNLPPGFEIIANPVEDGILGISWNNNIGTPPVFYNNETTVSIFDLQTRLVHQFQMNNQGGTTNVQHLSNGFYKVHIDLQNGSHQTLNLEMSNN